MSDKPDSTFGKWNRPILGFLAANSVASIIVDLKLFTESQFVYRESNIQFAIDFVKSGFAGGIFGLIFSIPLTIVPAILMIRWSERRSRTRLSTYVSGGFFVGFGVFLLPCLADVVSPILFDPSAKISLVRSFQIALRYGQSQHFWSLLVRYLAGYTGSSQDVMRVCRVTKTNQKTEYDAKSGMPACAGMTGWGSCATGVTKLGFVQNWRLF